VRRSPLRPVLGQVVLSWIAGRVVALSALALANYLVQQLQATAHATVHHTGLLGWDASFYQDIAQSGYGRTPSEGARFFPLTSLLARAVAVPLAGHTGLALLLVVNAAALGAALVLARLVLHEGWGEAAAARAAWLLALAPSSFVLVMGYAEALGILLGAAALLALRRRQWWLAAGLGLLTGLTRPTGLLLAGAAAVEAARDLRRCPGAERLARAAAVLAAPIGTAVYLGWNGLRYGQPLLPYTVQTTARLRGGLLTNPLRALPQDVHDALHGQHIGTALHLPWVLLMIALLVVMAVRLPASYVVLAGLTFAAAISSEHLNSVERYTVGAFPFLLVVALTVTRETTFRLLLAASSAAMLGYALLAFLQLYVP
jgi:hypothetical protein